MEVKQGDFVRIKLDGPESELWLEVSEVEGAYFHLKGNPAFEGTRTFNSVSVWERWRNIPEEKGCEVCGKPKQSHRRTCDEHFEKWAGDGSYMAWEEDRSIAAERAKLQKNLCGTCTGPDCEGCAKLQAPKRPIQVGYSRLWQTAEELAEKQGENDYCKSCYDYCPRCERRIRRQKSVNHA